METGAWHWMSVRTNHRLERRATLQLHLRERTFWVLTSLKRLPTEQSENQVRLTNCQHAVPYSHPSPTYLLIMAIKAHHTIRLTETACSMGKHDASNGDKQIIVFPRNSNNRIAPSRPVYSLRDTSKHSLVLNCTPSACCICSLLNAPRFPEAPVTQGFIHIDSLLLAHYR